ncbi:MAG: GNAT family N-acyltransferase [Acidimicrobiales bacterium]
MVALDAETAVVSRILRSDATSHGFGMYTLAASSECAKIARQVENEVFAEMFDQTPDEMRVEYSPYDEASRFLVVIDHRESQIAGVCRVVEYSPLGLPTLNDMAAISGWDISVSEIESRESLNINLSKSWDFTTLAVRKKYRKGDDGPFVSLALFHGLHWSCLVNEIDLGFIIFDTAVLSMLHDMGLHFFRAIKGLEPKEHMGSPSSVPCIAPASDVVPMILASGNSYARQIISGELFAGRLSMPDSIIDIRTKVLADAQ